MSVLEKIDKFLSEVTETAPDEEKWLTQKERSKHPYALKVAMIKKRKKKGKKVNEATVEFYTNAQDRKPSDVLQVKDVPALLRAVGMGAKKISLSSEGNRQVLNKALKAGKYIYVAFDPFIEQIAGKHDILWHTNRKEFVRIWRDLVMEV